MPKKVYEANAPNFSLPISMKGHWHSELMMNTFALGRNRTWIEISNGYEN
jgi:hypothetical protein